ncbi:MAG: winged helix-turn-helix domain-containing protein [Nitrosopumilus sp.]|nr:winged helix-turn-helix domain-containing protein [Nitrosopumilus sp.]CAI9830903.1 Transcriptional regulator, ArsR family [Nitrosopumilaceae archaeon]MDA7941314.1 winged helix-turn-helix domain-containing protein [Nitrosopumilus sp.]MDA7942725.1 winged helix-turn-helix domain-containing protein [Nitrosopumilus sp.]MDA7945289.1 winged helix-turn-helix domain-containing protein [Nitrosopumilus sp.]
MSDQLVEFRQILESRGTGGRGPDRETRKLLMYLFTSTRGGLSRLRIIMRLLEGPLNTHQISRELGMDYKAVQHHMRVLGRNNMVSKSGDKYGALFSLSPFLEMHAASLCEAIDALSRKMARRKVYL